MAKAILQDAETFEFVTSLGKRLDLHGALVSWSDKLSLGLAEHQILKRDGAIHQNLGAKPRIFAFACVMLGKNLSERYKNVSDALEEDPTGTLIHPRFGSLPAICRDFSAAEKPADELNTIRFTIEFAKTGLRSTEKPSPSSLAAAAIDALSNVETPAFVIPEVKATIGNIQTTTLVYQQKMNNFVQGQASILELSQVLGTIGNAVEKLRSFAQLPYSLKAQAALVFSQALAAFNAAQSNRPPLVSFLVPGGMSIQRLCASLYGGKHAKTMVKEILALNRIPNPYHLPAGVKLLLSDPLTVKTHAH